MEKQMRVSYNAIALVLKISNSVRFYDNYLIKKQQWSHKNKSRITY